MRIDYSTEHGEVEHSDPLDIGYDIPVPRYITVVKPGEPKKVKTGLRMNLPRFSRLRRFIFKLVFGIDITGIGMLVWPRGSTDVTIGAGVIDTGYTGEVVVKAVNPTSNLVAIGGSPFAQMVPILTMNIEAREVQSVEEDTKRGNKGGIWNTDSE